VVVGEAEVDDRAVAGRRDLGEAIFIGLGPAIQRMRALMDEARATRAA
jgi:hypothetical protein